MTYQVVEGVEGLEAEGVREENIWKRSPVKELIVTYKEGVGGATVPSAERMVLFLDRFAAQVAIYLYGEGFKMGG